MQNLKQYLKQQIKEKSALQRDYKLQRKTIHFKGVRTMPSYKAIDEHTKNRYMLRMMFIVYGMERGKTINQIEGPNATGFIPSYIEQYKDFFMKDYVKNNPEFKVYV